VATYAAGKFRTVFEETKGQHGYALGQLDPNICNDSEKMIAQGLRYASWAENISVKTPSIQSALPLVEADSHLGWECVNGYIGGRERIVWKLRHMEKLYNLK
jgi:transaldolase